MRAVTWGHQVDKRDAIAMEQSGSGGRWEKKPSDWHIVPTPSLGILLLTTGMIAMSLLIHTRMRQNDELSPPSALFSYTRMSLR